jgi:hypothetical protein
MDLCWVAYAIWNRTSPTREPEEFNKPIIANAVITWEKEDADDIESS